MEMEHSQPDRAQTAVLRRPNGTPCIRGAIYRATGDVQRRGRALKWPRRAPKSAALLRPALPAGVFNEQRSFSPLPRTTLAAIAAAARPARDSNPSVPATWGRPFSRNEAAATRARAKWRGVPLPVLERRSVARARVSPAARHVECQDPADRTRASPVQGGSQ